MLALRVEQHQLRARLPQAKVVNRAHSVLQAPTTSSPQMRLDGLAFGQQPMQPGQPQHPGHLQQKVRPATAKE